MRKGKGKLCDEDGMEKKRSNSGERASPLLSNPNFPDPIPDADTTDEGNSYKNL